MRTGLLALVAAIVAAVAGPRLAAASTRVAVAAFDGDRTGDLQDVVIELLESDYAIVDRRRVMKSIERLGLDDVDNNKALAKIAADLDADAVIIGEVEPDGSKSKLVIRVYIASSRRAFRMTARFSTSRQVRDSELRAELRDVLGGGDGGVSRRGKVRDDDLDRGRDRERDDRERDDRERDDRERDDRERDERERDADDDRDRKRKRTARGDDDDDDDDDGIGARASAGGGARPARKAAVRVEVGMSGMGRKLQFVTNLPVDQAPPGYSHNLVPGARVSAEVYPLALQDPDGLAAGFGVAGEYEKAIGLTTTSSLLPASPLTTTSRMFAVGVRYRFAYGTRVTNPSFTVGIGYGQRKFTIDRRPLMGLTLDTPNVIYKYIDPYVAARIPVHAMAAISVAGRFLAMRDTGPIGTDAQYGRAKVTGVDVQAGMEFQLGRYVVIHFAGVFTQIGFTFNPPGGNLANSRDGNPDDLDVGGARDRYYGATAAVGVVY